MTENRESEDGAQGGEHGAAPDAPEPSPPAKRSSSLLARSPVIALLVAALAGWLLWSLLPELAYFASPLVPIELGRRGAYRLAEARENRLVQVEGELVDTVAVSEGRTGATRTVGRLAGTNLLVDRPGRGGPPIFEGRLLPASRREAYGEVARILRGHGAPLGDAWMVLRDGERPRRQWLSVLGAVLLVAVLAINIGALIRPLFPRSRERR
jgi:hypothetical protein